MNEKTSSLGTASKILARQISGKITHNIGKALNLDVIEFSGSKNWNQASIIIGKYLTNDLYVSYEKEFNVLTSNELTTEELTLEYKVLRNLYLQAKQGNRSLSGVDVFLKFSH